MTGSYCHDCRTHLDHGYLCDTCAELRLAALVAAARSCLCEGDEAPPPPDTAPPSQSTPAVQRGADTVDVNGAENES